MITISSTDWSYWLRLFWGVHIPTQWVWPQCFHCRICLLHGTLLTMAMLCAVFRNCNCLFRIFDGYVFSKGYIRENRTTKRKSEVEVLRTKRTAIVSERFRKLYFFASARSLGCNMHQMHAFVLVFVRMSHTDVFDSCNLTRVYC